MIGKARNDHGATAHDAASKIDSVSGLQRRNVYATICASGKHGMTDQEIQTALHLDPSSERPRRVELVEAGMIEDSGETRSTTSGRSAVVWRIKTKQLVENQGALFSAPLEEQSVPEYD